MKRLLILVAIVLSHTINVSTEQLFWLKGTYTPFLTEPLKKHIGLSPLVGALGWYSGLIKGLHMYGNPTDATIKLVKLLFLDHSGQMVPTYGKSGKGMFLIMQTGFFPQLIDLVFKQNLDFENENAAMDIKRALGTYAERQKIGSQDKHQMKQFLKKLIPIIRQAQGESHDNKYPTLLVEQIMSTYWYAIQDKFRGHAPVDTHFPGTLLQYMSVFIPTYVPAQYTEAELETVQETIKRTSYNVPVELDKEDAAALITPLLATDAIEKTIISILKNMSAGSEYPPRVEMSSYGYHGANPSPNCAETMLQNFLNYLVFDVESNIYNPEYLPATANQQLREFYAGERLQPQNSTLATTGQAWFDTVSNIPGVAYNRGNYEIRNGNENILKVLNHLLVTRANKFEELSAPLSTATRAVQLTTLEDGGFIASITLGEKTRSAKFHTHPGHGYAEFPGGAVESDSFANQVGELDPVQEMLFAPLCSEESYSHDTLTYGFYIMAVRNQQQLAEIIAHCIDAAVENNVAAQFAATIITVLGKIPLTVDDYRRFLTEIFLKSDDATTDASDEDEPATAEDEGAEAESDIEEGYEVSDLLWQKIPQEIKDYIIMQVNQHPELQAAVFASITPAQLSEFGLPNEQTNLATALTSALNNANIIMVKKLMDLGAPLSIDSIQGASQYELPELITHYGLPAFIKIATSQPLEDNALTNIIAALPSNEQRNEFWNTISADRQNQLITYTIKDEYPDKKMIKWLSTQQPDRILSLLQLLNADELLTLCANVHSPELKKAIVTKLLPLDSAGAVNRAIDSYASDKMTCIRETPSLLKLVTPDRIIHLASDISQNQALLTDLIGQLTPEQILPLANAFPDIVGRDPRLKEITDLMSNPYDRFNFLARSWTVLENTQARDILSQTSPSQTQLLAINIKHEYTGALVSLIKLFSPEQIAPFADMFPEIIANDPRFNEIVPLMQTLARSYLLAYLADMGNAQALNTLSNQKAADTIDAIDRLPDKKLCHVIALFSDEYRQQLLSAALNNFSAYSPLISCIIQTGTDISSIPDMSIINLIAHRATTDAPAIIAKLTPKRKAMLLAIISAWPDAESLVSLLSGKQPTKKTQHSSHESSRKHRKNGNAPTAE